MKDRRTDSEIRDEALTYAQQLLVAYIDPQYDLAVTISAIPKAARPEVLFMMTKLIGDMIKGLAGDNMDPEQMTDAIATVFDRHRS